MDHSYNSPESAKAYREFLSSVDGKIFRSTLAECFIKNSPANPGAILDAGCGDGWLAGELKTNFPESKVFACDAGQLLIEEARQKFPQVEFAVHDLGMTLPYPDKYFDLVTASMVLHDTENEAAVLQNFARVLKEDGVLLASIVNPYYGFPIGAWKRGFWGRLLGRKPKLKIVQDYNTLAKKSRPNFQWRAYLGSHFTPLSKHLEAANKAGFAMTRLVDISSEADSPSYNLTYQLHRAPIILLLEFRKII